MSKFRHTDIIFAAVSVSNLVMSILHILMIEKGLFVITATSVVVLSIFTLVLIIYKMIRKEKIAILFKLSFMYAVLIVLLWLSTFTFLAAD